MDMLFSWAMLVVGLVVILIGCDVFTNSIEWLGKKLDLNEGVLGSVFAAVGTALPETLIPIVAVVSGAAAANGESSAHDVGIGAIIGAPFMLATVAMFVTGTAIYIFSRQGRRTPIMRVNSRILGRDIRFFLVGFSVAIASGFIEDRLTKIFIAIALVAMYAFYVFKHATDVAEEAPDEDVEALSPLHFARRDPEPGMGKVVLQVFAGLGLIIGAAYLFVQYVEDVAVSLGVTPLILALIIVPLATELPEKFNSVIWVRRSKDTLALGNITGAMVFQSTLPVAFGITFTDWKISPEYVPAFAQAAIAIVAALLLFASMVQQKKLHATALVLSGLWYVVWIILVFPMDIAKLAENWGWLR